MINQENDTCKKSSKALFNLINVGSLLVLLVSLLFTYQYFIPLNQLNKQLNDQRNVDRLDKRNDKRSISNGDKNVAQNNHRTFLDNFKQLDLSQFIDKDSFDQANQPNLTSSHVDQFNNNQLLPRLLSIVDMDYFKYIKLNLNKKCTLWPDDAKCSRKDCTIRTCDESRLPDYIVNTDDWKEHHNGQKQAKDSSADDTAATECAEDQLANSTSQQLQQIVTNVISNEKLSTMNELFECYVSEYEDGEFYDLKMNPEQFTGYRGPTAHRIWRSIYEENCFKSKKIQLNDVQQFESFLNVDDLCLEEKIFYRTISGLHTSINIHLSRYYHFKDGSIGFNLKEFLKRFEG